MNIFALWGEIEINRRQAEQDIKSVEDQAEKSGQKMESAFNKVTQAVNALLGKVGDLGQKIVAIGKNTMKKAGVPLAALTALMGGLAKKTADYGDQMAKSAQEVGMNAEAYQELTYVLGQNNLGAEESLRVFGRLNQRIGLARKGNENYRKSLEQMGVSMDALDKGLIGTEEAFEHIIEYLSGMEDSQLQAAYASDIFGTMLSRKMMPLIRSGSEGVAELRDRARELGIVLDEEFAERSEVFGDTMDDLKQTASGLTRAFGKELLAPFINIGRVITDVIAGMSRWVSENPKLVRQIIMFGGAIVGVLGVLFTLGMALTATGKIIGALGTVMGILVSKPMLIIAAIGLLYLAWEKNWFGIRDILLSVWEVIGPPLETIIKWGKEKLKTTWDWAVGAIPEFITWIKNTAWPAFNSTVSTAWNWTVGNVSSFVKWIKNTAWPFIGGTVKTTWDWSKGKIDRFVVWVKESAWPWINGVAQTTWQWAKGNIDTFVYWIYTIWNYLTNGVVKTTWDWIKGNIDNFILWIKDTAWPWINKTVKTTWDWTIDKIDNFILWIKNTAWPWINGTVKTTWEWTVKGLDAVKDWLGIGTKSTPKTKQLDQLLDAIYRAEGGAGARVPYGMTTFADKPVKYASPTDQARWEELSQGLDVGSEEYWRAAAQTTVEHYWRWFKTRFPELGEKTFDEVGPELQSMFVTYLGAHFAPPEASDLNPNWVPNVLKFMGFDELSKEFRAGSSNIMDAWIDTIYDKAGDVEAAVQWITEIVARYMIGASPPPLGPLSNIDEGGANVMGAWIEGAEDGLKDGVPTLTKMLNGIKGLFASVWDKVPDEVKGPIEQAMVYVSSLIEQAENALWKLDEFQDQLERLLGGGENPEAEAQGFMTRLKKSLDEKLKLINDPIDRFANELVESSGVLGSVIASLKLIKESNKELADANEKEAKRLEAIIKNSWVGVILALISETESFAKAMELIGAVLQPVVTLFDAVLKPIINGILSLWNGIIDALVSISIFGWQPFKGLKDKKIGLVGEGDKTEIGQDKSSGGRQISEITGPTRDLLVDLLSPLANFGQVIAPVQDIRNILYERLPNFNSMDFAGAGGMGGNVTIQNLNVTAPTTGVNDISRATIDEIEKALADRLAFNRRGRAGR